MIWCMYIIIPPILLLFYTHLKKGPMVSNIKGKAKLVGVTSWGFGCANKNYPGIYTNVANVKQWILKTITDSSKSHS